MYKIGPIGDHSGKVWLGSSGILNLWPSIGTGVSSTKNNLPLTYQYMKF